MSNPNFDQILSTTLKNHLPKLEDNVFSARPLAFFLKESGNIRTIDGGAKIVLPLIHALNNSSGSYSGVDPLTTTAAAGITAAEYDWRQFYVTITISGIEEAQNSGTEALIDLLEAKTMQAEETITEKFDIMFFADGTGNSGKDWFGLGNLVKAHPNDTTIGGINPQSNAYWASNRTALGGPLTVAAMTTLFNTCSVGNDKPNVILTTQTLFEKYEALLQPQARYTDMKAADAGFQNLMFKGTPVTYDVNTVAGDVFFLNSKYLRLVGHKDVWFKPTPFVRPENVDARFAQILCYGQLTASNRKRQGVLTGATA